MAPIKRLPAVFYRSSGGSEPVREWLKGLSEKDRRIIGFDIATAEFGWPVGMPICRSLGKGLWEIRSTLSGGRIARTMFCVADGEMFLLHGLLKKTQKTPKSELELAYKRQRETSREK